MADERFPERSGNASASGHDDADPPTGSPGPDDGTDRDEISADTPYPAAEDADATGTEPLYPGSSEETLADPLYPEDGPDEDRSDSYYDPLDDEPRLGDIDPRSWMGAGVALALVLLLGLALIAGQRSKPKVAARPNASPPVNSVEEPAPTPSIALVPAPKGFPTGDYKTRLSSGPAQGRGTYHLVLEPSGAATFVFPGNQTVAMPFIVKGNQVSFGALGGACPDEGIYRWKAGPGSIEFTGVGKDPCAGGARRKILEGRTWRKVLPRSGKSSGPKGNSGGGSKPSRRKG